MTPPASSAAPFRRPLQETWASASNATRRPCRAVKSSWGDTFYTYGPNGDLQRVEAQRGKAAASVELAGGRVRRAAGFDGGNTVFEYHDDGDLAGAVRKVTCPNGLALARSTTRRTGLPPLELGRTAASGWDMTRRGAWSSTRGSAGQRSEAPPA